MRFVYNPLCEAEMRFTPMLQPEVNAMMQEKLQIAREIAPVDTGTYKASLGAGTDFSGPGGQIRGVLFTTDVEHKVVALEFGTSIPTPTFATLRRALYGGGQSSYG